MSRLAMIAVSAVAPMQRILARPSARIETWLTGLGHAATATNFSWSSNPQREKLSTHALKFKPIEAADAVRSNSAR
jgi:hypothetical protein